MECDLQLINIYSTKEKKMVSAAYTLVGRVVISKVIG